MSPRKLTHFQQRIAEYGALLEVMTKQQMPWVCETPMVIDKLLALSGADLVRARFDPPVTSYDGFKHIARAVVTGITPAGRAMVERAQKVRVREFQRRDDGSTGRTPSSV